MKKEESEGIENKIGTWILTTTGAALLAAGQILAVALTAWLSSTMSKDQLVKIIGAESLLPLAFLVLAHRTLARQNKALVAAEKLASGVSSVEGLSRRLREAIDALDKGKPSDAEPFHSIQANFEHIDSDLRTAFKLPPVR